MVLDSTNPYIPVLVAVEAVGVVLVLRGALVAEPGDGDDADEDAQHADADPEERELGRRVALVRPAVLILQWARRDTMTTMRVIHVCATWFCHLAPYFRTCFRHRVANVDLAV